MENKRRKWSKYEERVVRTYVKKHPENLHYCFFLASKEIDRTPKAISGYYYKRLKNKEGNFLFNLFSAFKSLVNIKNKLYQYGEESEDIR